MRASCRRLLVIDDLADRPHDCDLLLDQNLGRRAEEYRELLPPGAQTLIGPHYALLRPEFAALRAESLARREHPHLRHLLITMGGVDKDNATGAVLAALDDCNLPTDLRITVVLGPHAPWLAQVQARAAAMSRPTRVLAGVSNMARLMADADLAIGAAGSTSWERCCLGLPTILLVLAENQRLIAQSLAQAGLAVTMVPLALRHSLPRFFLDKGLPSLLLTQSVSGSSIVDGRGAGRVSSLLRER
jgi:UDP-2,4-diacetamido-2,4,6-trideoxy-beta-L-altropyranose hydrolase